MIVVVVVDRRVEYGGYEAWAETLVDGINRNELSEFKCVLINVCSEFPEVSDADRTPSGAGRVVRVTKNASDVEVALAIGRELIQLAKNSFCGFFLSLSYGFVNTVSLNLRGGPWVPIAVMHGPYTSALPWFLAIGSPVLVVPSRKIEAMCADWLTAHSANRPIRNLLRYIPHGVQVHYRTGVRDDHDCGNRSDLFRIAAVSRLNFDTKRPIDYIKFAIALREIREDFILEVYGDGPAASQMHELIDQSNARSYIRMRGQVGHLQVVEALCHADLFVSTSEAEAFGLGLAEAMGAGLPVVCADGGGSIAELVTPDCGVRVPVGDTARMALEASRLLDDVARRVRMGHAGRCKVRDQYSVTSMLEAYQSLFSEFRHKAAPDPSWTLPATLLTDPSMAMVPAWRRWLKPRTRLRLISRYFGFSK